MGVLEEWLEPYERLDRAGAISQPRNHFMTISKQLLESILDQLYELKGERSWWALEPRCGYQRRYKELCELIAEIEGWVSTIPESSNPVAFGDMWIAPSGALAFCWTVTWNEHRHVMVAEAVTCENGKWNGGLTSCDATWVLRKRIKKKIPDPQSLKLAICRAACAEIDRPIEYAAWKHGAPEGWVSGIPHNS